MEHYKRKYILVYAKIGSAIKKNFVVKKIATRYPKSYAFLLRRFTLKKFSGLPLTFLFASFLANLLLLTKIVETVEDSPAMMAIDKSFALFLYDLRTTAVADLFYYFTGLGSLPSIVILSVTVSVYFILKKKYFHFISILISLIGTETTVLLGKTYFHRLRPEGFAFYKITSYSFPSGHSTVAVSFYGLLFYFIIREANNFRSRLNWSITAVIFILLLGLSRLYLGVHYLSDVAAGYSLGLLWLLLSISVLEWLTYRKGLN